MPVPLSRRSRCHAGPVVTPKRGLGPGVLCSNRPEPLNGGIGHLMELWDACGNVCGVGVGETWNGCGVWLADSCGTCL